ncbi:uncharacterized protein VTP21DRAFT_6959 [Calcarisporiella thermophila]|uniref:uncharacterized protein n=1 Tax=Calcarisporiella thermophila TaxID=911321 RepID=UPI003741E9CC
MFCGKEPEGNVIASRRHFDQGQRRGANLLGHKSERMLAYENAHMKPQMKLGSFGASVATKIGQANGARFSPKANFHLQIHLTALCPPAPCILARPSSFITRRPVRVAQAGPIFLSSSIGSRFVFK